VSFQVQYLHFLFASRGQSNSLKSDKTNRPYCNKLRQLQIMRGRDSINSELEVKNFELNWRLSNYISFKEALAPFLSNVLVKWLSLES